MTYVRILFLVAVAWLCGCTHPQLQIKGGGFRNLCDDPIENVELHIVGTRRVISASYISARGYFGTVIPIKPYEGNEIEVSWTCRRRHFHSGPFKIPVPDPVPEEPVVAVIRFYPTGKTEALFMPVSQIPPRFLR